MKDRISLRATSGMDQALLLTGVPFARGQLDAGSHLEIGCGAMALPLWYEPRSRWPDGSVKWVFLHARVPAGSSELDLRIRAGEAETAEAPSHASDRLAAGGMRLVTESGSIRCDTADSSWVLEQDRVDTDLEAASRDALSMSLIEPSPVAPLVRINTWRGSGQDRPQGLVVEYLARLDPLHSRVLLTRRMTWNRDGRFTLRSARARIRLTPAPAGEGRIVVHEPGSVLGEGGKTLAGHPEGRVDLPGFSLWLEKAWQRAPFALEWSGGVVDVSFYAATARALGVTGGTSFRHTLEIVTGRSAAETAAGAVEVVIDPAHLADCGALGSIADPETARRDFPGYEKSLRATLESGRLRRLSRADADGLITPDGEPAPLERETEQDRDYFGLQHYGDWPMPWGSYGLKDRRMYASNEYDPAYAYFQGYALYGDWRYREVARHSAEHMSDVDIISTTGDMRFHGYNESAEDHELARSGGEYGHYWTDGYWILYFLCGDVWARESALGVTETIVKRLAWGGEDYLRSIWAGAERHLGWPMVALMGSYEAVGHPGALETVRRMVAFVDRFTADPDRDLEEESGSAEVPVSYWRTAMQDGCKPFMVGVVLEGLERFHRVTGDEKARESIVRLARWLIDTMWLPHEATFVYEYNGYGRGHRLAKPHDLTPLFVRGLGYAYELSSDERIREVSEKAFYGCLWTLYSPSSGGKSIGMMGRTLGAYVAMLDSWNRRDRAVARASIAPSAGSRLEHKGGVAALLASGAVELRRGSPRYDGNALISEGESFVEGRFARPVSTNTGEIAFRVWLAPGSTSFLNKRSCLQLSDDRHTSAAVSIIIFYTNLHVRIYDERRAIIEVAEGFIQDVDAKGAPVQGKTYPAWKEGEWHEVAVEWRVPVPGRPGLLELRMDGIVADRRELDRPIGGRFTRISLGHKPGNWRLFGKLELDRLLLG